MSWDVSILDQNGKVMECITPHKLSGGRIRANENLEQIPINDASINITYNYSKQFSRSWSSGSLQDFHGKKAYDIIGILQDAITKLDGTSNLDYESVTGQEVDYWTATPENAKKALQDLLFLCRECPDGIIDIS